MSNNLQNVFTNTSNRPLKELNDKDREMYEIVLQSPSFKNFKPIRGGIKSTK